MKRFTGNDPAEALRRVRETIDKDVARSSAVLAALDELTHQVAELEILCIRAVAEARRAGITYERKRVREILELHGHDSGRLVDAICNNRRSEVSNA